MVRVYFDLETYRPNKEGAFTEERVISAGLLIDETPNCEDSLKTNIEPILLSEWAGLSECDIVGRVHNRIKETLANHRFTVVIGFNILRFDIPLMICRCSHHSVETHEVLSKMWNNCFTIDYFQQLLVANKNYFKGLSCSKVIEVSRQLGLKPPSYTASGGSVKDFYDQGKYKEIEEHLKEDLRIVRWLDLYGAKRLIEMSGNQGKPLFQE
jgi:DNA polymerase elongation subunit (family B)